MYRKHLCTKCQAELPPEEASVPPKRKGKVLLRCLKVLFFPVYVVLFPVFAVLVKVIGYVRYKDFYHYHAPYELYQDVKKVQISRDVWVPVHDEAGNNVMTTYRREFRYRKPEYTYWRLWDNEPEETKPK